MSKLRPGGGYRTTCNFQTATLIYDECSKPMVLRTAKTGRNAGQQFWGGSTYPGCKGTVQL